VKHKRLLAELDKKTTHSAVVLAQAAYNATNEQSYMQMVA
jgi:hypothetical protein